MALDRETPPLKQNFRLGELSAARNDESGGLRACRIKAILHVLPVHNVPECLDVIALNVLVLQVKCVLPHVEHEEGHGADSQVALRVVELFDYELLVHGFPGQNGPARSLNSQRRGREVSAKAIKRTKELTNCCGQIAGGLIATLGGHVLPKDSVVYVPSQVESEVLL